MKKYLSEVFEKELKSGLLNPYFDIANTLLPSIDYIAKLDYILTKECSVKTKNPFLYASKYIEEKHPTYYPEFARMWQANEIHVSNYESDNAECDSYTGEIWAGKSCTILDDLNLVHEFFHHQNLTPINKGGKNSFTRELFGEAISITAQFDFIKFLEKTNLCEDALIVKITYLNDCIKSARKIMVELILIELYKLNGKITDEIVKKYISYCKDEKLAIIIDEEYEDVLTSIGNWGANFKFPFNLKYFLGIIIGCHLSNLVNENQKKWEDIYIINKHFYYINEEEFLNKAGIKLDNDDLLLVFTEHFQRADLMNDNFKKQK